MYEVFFGLRERPFDLTANPRFLFLTPSHKEALGNLQYGIGSHKGITLLLGEAGTGKTTLVRAALEQLRGQRSRIAYLSNPTLTRSEFVEFVADAFGLSPAATSSKVRMLAELTAALSERAAEGGVSALVIDEAQSLPHELLEEIRLLSNLETASEKLLPVVLAGQPELADRLNDASLRQLKQRVALRCALQPLDLKETAAYMAKRLRIAGGDGASIFTADAVRAIYRHSRGIPRNISVLCDNSLVSGFALDRRPVDADIVEDVARDFDLAPGATPGLMSDPGRARVEPLVPGPGQDVQGRESGVPPGENGDGLARPPQPKRPMFQFFAKRRRFSFF
jgi:general secretion pathway protein A